MNKVHIFSSTLESMCNPKKMMITVLEDEKGIIQGVTVNLKLTHSVHIVQIKSHISILQQRLEAARDPYFISCAVVSSVFLTI